MEGIVLEWTHVIFMAIYRVCGTLSKEEGKEAGML